jgi:hypothetical protein
MLTLLTVAKRHTWWGWWGIMPQSGGRTSFIAIIAGVCKLMIIRGFWVFTKNRVLL